VKENKKESRDSWRKHLIGGVKQASQPKNWIIFLL